MTAIFRALIDAEEAGPAPASLSIGARQHALLAGVCPEETRQALERDNWTCHVCQTHLPGFAEVDHLKGHRPCKADEMRAICQVCHHIKHIVWSASRSSLQAIYAPDISQITVTRLCWSTTLDGEDDVQDGADELRKSLLDRADLAARHVGSSDPRVLIEGVRSIRIVMGQGAAQRAADRLDQVIRFAPRFVMEGRLPSAWTRSGFRDWPHIPDPVDRVGGNIPISIIDQAAQRVSASL